MHALNRWTTLVVLAIALIASPALAQMPKVGDKAPEFSVASTTGKPVALADYRGSKHVVLFFYIAAFTGT